MNWIFWTLLVFFIVAFIWIAYEIYHAPLMPDDFDVDFTDEDIDEWFNQLHK